MHQANPAAPAALTPSQVPLGPPGAADVFRCLAEHRIVVPNPQEVAAHSFQAMGEMDLADPSPPRLITVWLYSHPPLAVRLKFAHDYDPWDKGEPPKYVK